MSSQEQLPAPRPVVTVEEHVAVGAKARAAVPPEALGPYTAAADRPDPLALLEGQSADRIPELIPVRYGRMLVSPFTFYRGAALLMASDLSTQPRTSLQAQLCGDAHLSNFGGFASPERNLIFDINDFDETNPGPFEWDIKRLVTSMEVAGQDHGFTKKERTAILDQTIQGYRDAIQAFASRGNLEVWYSMFDIDALAKTAQEQLDKKSKKKGTKDLNTARTRTSMQAADKLTRVVNGRRQFIDDPPVIERAETLVAKSDKDLTANSEAMPGAWQQYVDRLLPDRRHLRSQFTYV
ncbi:MAG: DUF2252 family protein, partial [bacterium]